MKHTKIRDEIVNNIRSITAEVLDNIEWVDCKGNKIKVKKISSDKIRRILSNLSNSKINNKKWISILEAESVRRQNSRLSSLHY